MSILSIKFLLFFSILILGYYIIPSKYRWIVLLAGSYVFYAMGNRKWLLLIFFTTIQTFLASGLLGKLNRRIKEELKQIADKEARKAAKEKLIRKKKWVVAITLVLNFGILFFFKTSYLWSEVSLLLPLGISFYTFQTIGYLIDVYRSKYEPEKNLFKYALFASYFPQIIQGPINRFDKLMPQFLEERRFEWRRIKLGFWLFLWGMFKKVVISDRAAIFVSAVLGGELQERQGSLILVGGDPGIGKSTLLLQICECLGENYPVLYVSGEESGEQIKMRAERIGVQSDSIKIMTATDTQAICEYITSSR